MKLFHGTLSAGGSESEVNLIRGQQLLKQIGDGRAVF
jgi:hypothetical protein